jgi:PucR C-terminal helix-turn-helix domain
MAGATVGQLWRAVFPGARSVSASETLERPVAWVRVLKARTPAFDALEANDLAIVPVSALANLSSIAVDASSVIDAITAAGGCGVVVVGDADEPGPRQVVASAVDRGLAAFAMVDTDVNALERSAISFVVNARAELDARAAALELELERAALDGAGPDGLAAVISRFFARPVALEADDGSVLAAHAGAETTAATPQVSRYLRNRRGAALRVALPSTGSLVLLGPEPVSELERVASSRVAPFLAVALAAPVPEVNGARLRRATERMPAAGPPWVVMVARQFDAGDDGSTTDNERIRAALRQLEPARRLQLRGDATSLEVRVVFAPSHTDATGTELATHISRRLSRPVAVSEPFSAQADRAVREATARSTLEAFELLPAAERAQLAAPDGATVVRAELLPALRLMAGLAAVPDAPRHARALLQPLMSGRRTRDAHALATLRAVLDHAGMAEAASALGIHRNTLAYRLAAIERRTGWRMSDPLVRFGLALAVRLVQNDQDFAG